MSVKKQGRPALFIDQIPTFTEIGDNAIISVEFTRKQVKASIYHYNKSKNLNPTGQKISYKYLGGCSYLITLIKKGS